MKNMIEGDRDKKHMIKTTIEIPEKKEVGRIIFLEKGIEKIVCLSKQQTRCAHFASLGFTSKMIGLRMEISTRTVEDYLNNIKDKIGFSYKTDFCEKLIKVEGYIDD